MAIRIALHHKTSYRYDRRVALSPHEVRLRPAPHARTPILSYSLTVEPTEHFINWQQDPYGNYIGRFVFPEKADKLEFTVDLVADMTVINPFDFFIENYAETFPFAYPDELKAELSPYLQTEPPAPLLAEWVAAIRRDLLAHPMSTIDFLVTINQRLQGRIGYLLRMEPGVQTPEDTLRLCSGSCRDSGWLLVHILRELGLAARFVSGYLIQLRADQEAIDGPGGPLEDFTDLHAWAEVYIPGAGWIGLDPTSGMLAGEGHIPLACTAMPASAAPVTGFTDKAEVEFVHEMTVTRIHEDPRVTKPYSEADWQKIDLLGRQVDAELERQDVRLTQGGEPTFVSIDDMDGAEWNTLAHGDRKRELAGKLMLRLKNHFAPGGMLHYGQGKWYPGEPLPRWALNIYWRVDGQPMWRDATLFSDEQVDDGYGTDDAGRFVAALVESLGLGAGSAIPAYEDVLLQAQREQALPRNVDPLQADLKAPEERRRLARLLERGLGEVAGYVLPLKPATPADAGMAGTRWQTSAWPIRREHLYLLEGDSPIGLRLPLATLPWVSPEERDPAFDVDPFVPRGPLPAAQTTLRPIPGLAPGTPADPPARPTEPGAREVIHTALCVEVRAGRLYVFMPPLTRIEDYLALLTAVENSAAQLKMKLRIEGYAPPRDPRIKLLSVTPDPGVIEVNIHPAASWDELAFQQMDKVLPTLAPGDKPWMVDRLLRNLLVDLTGNTHRAEFSIDKLYSPDGPTGRLGLVEFRAFEMPPHERMSLLQMLLLRALVARFWKQPCQARLVHWGTALHDRWMLPHFVSQDIRDVARDLRAAGYAFEDHWFDPFIEFRFPRFGTVVYEGVEMELRQAIEPWNVLGEEVGAAGTARYVDSSVERMQLRVRGLTDGRHVVACNGRMLPLHPTGIPGEYVAGVRFRAWSPWSALHPSIGVQAPLVFDLVDTWNGRSIGGCTYHVAHPGGRNETGSPVNANAAEARRMARFWPHGHTPGPMTVPREEPNPGFPMTLDLRWQPA